MEIQREYEYTDLHFNMLRKLVADHAGINLSDAKRELVYSRIVRRIRKLDLDGFDSYCRLLKGSPDAEGGHFVNAITTNLTSFFREPYHFDFLAKDLLPDLIRRRSRERRLRIWSAGCSTGEEAYTLAMVISEQVPRSMGWHIRILATDIDSDVLSIGAAGIYDEARVTGLSDYYLRRFSLRGRDGNAGKIRMSNVLSDMISFKQSNLMDDWLLNGKMDIVLCRNVVIYFDKPTQRRLFDRIADVMVDGGHLFIGHAESLFRVSDRFELLGRTIYRKIH